MNQARSNRAERGKLIAFEGLDGCGKSTQIGHLAARLRAAGIDVLATFEPTEGETGQRIRAMARSGRAVAPETELAWFVADRREHVDFVIEPALAAGRWVLSDRYTLSSVAYQGGRGLDAADILEQSETDFPVPDLVVLFELSPARGLRRVASRKGVPEPHFEKQDFLERVAAIFRDLDRPYIERVDAAPEPDVVSAKVAEIVGRRLGLALSSEG